MGRSHLDLWDLYFGGSYDDAGVGSFFDVYGRRERNEGGLQWALLLYIRIRDFIGPGDGNFQNFEVRTDFIIGAHHTQRPSALQTSTSQVYDYVANEWSADCGGGGEWIKCLTPRYPLKRETLQSGGQVWGFRRCSGCVADAKHRGPRLQKHDYERPIYAHLGCDVPSAPR